MGTPRDIDRGWAWIVLFASFMSHVVIGTFSYGAGMLHTALLQHFEGDVAFTALIGSVFTSLMSLMGPVSSVLINISSCRVTHILGGIICVAGFCLSFFVHRLDLMLLTYGILAGLGQSLCITPAIVILGFYFEKYRGIAIGVAVSGGGCGMFISGPVVQFLLDHYGLHGAYLLSGGIAAHLIILGMLLIPSSAELSNKRKRKLYREADAKRRSNCRNKCANFVNIFNPELFKNKTYLFILIGSFLWNMPYSTVLLHLPNFAVVRGSSVDNAALLLTYIGLGSTINRILTGLSLGPNGLDPLLLFIGILGVAGFLTILFPLYSQVYVGQCIFSFLFGIYSGGLMALLAPLALDLVGLQQLSSALGIMFLIGGIGYILGPPLAGAIVDNGGTYEHSFYLSGACFFLASIICLVSVTWRKIHTKEEEMTDIDSTFPAMDNTASVFKGSRFLSGSGFLTGSLVLTVFPSTDNVEQTEEGIGTESLFKNDTASYSVVNGNLSNQKSDRLRKDTV